MPRRTRPRRPGPCRERGWRIERTRRIVHSRRARLRAHLDRENIWAPHRPPIRLDDYLAVRARGQLDDDATWDSRDPGPSLWFWLRVRQLDRFCPAPTPPLCRCAICHPPLEDWVSDVRRARRAEHGAYDLRDGDPRWVDPDGNHRTG